MSTKRSEDRYSNEDAERRLGAALLGARITGHKPMSGIPKKRAKKAKATAKKRVQQRT
jgi:hypothetical protein